MENKPIHNISHSRRRFLIGSAASAGIFVLGVHLPSGNSFANAVSTSDEALVNAFVGIDAEGIVTIRNPYIEMGQGTYTSIPMIIAEELDVPMKQIRVIQAPPGAEYRLLFNNTKRLTGGSRSVRMSYMALRKAGATARQMLLQAAAKQSRQNLDQLKTIDGKVILPDGKEISYGQLAATAATLPVPDQNTIQLKSKDEFKLIGKPVKRTDVEAKSTGQAQFGIDSYMEGMIYAAIRHSPVFGGKIGHFDAASLKQKHPEVIAVEPLRDAVAVIAPSYWKAAQAIKELDAHFEYEYAPSAHFSSAQYQKEMQSQLDETGVVAENKGDALAAIKDAAHHISADYTAPFIAHATMEPMNCSCLIKDGHCTIWAPNQSVDMVLQAVIETSGLKEDQITINTPFLGGGFGRRFMTDFVVQAVTLATRHPGRPIKLIWSREEDIQHDFYRPMTAIRLRAGLNQDKKPLATHITVAGEGPRRRHWATADNPRMIDSSVVEGTIALPYKLANHTDYLYQPMGVPIGFWRSVGHSMNAFFTESFIDEIAHASGQDPVTFRREQLSEAPRYRNVLDRAVEMADWKNKPWTAEDGTQRAMGVALHEAFGSIVAQVAEVSAEDGEIVVHRVSCAVDCGFAVNPKIVTMQMESAIAFGLSAALLEEITIENGRVKQANFDSYPILPPKRMPKIDVAIINSGEALGGIGEPGTPPIAPAVANALFTLTDIRLRSLPLDGDALIG